MADRQQVPHNFLICDRTDEPCFWPACQNHGCMESAIVDEIKAEREAIKGDAP